jgi:hypothetical protein
MQIFDLVPRGTFKFILFNYMIIQIYICKKGNNLNFREKLFLDKILFFYFCIFLYKT